MKWWIIFSQLSLFLLFYIIIIIFSVQNAIAWAFPLEFHNPDQISISIYVTKSQSRISHIGEEAIALDTAVNHASLRLFHWKFLALSCNFSVFFRFYNKKAISLHLSDFLQKRRFFRPPISRIPSLAWRSSAWHCSNWLIFGKKRILHKNWFNESKARLMKQKCAKRIFWLRLVLANVDPTLPLPNEW